MVTLACAVIGEDSIVVVDIQKNRLVGHLKEEIKKKKPNRICCDADHPLSCKKGRKNRKKQ
jgi:hypothetical protein